ncbi:class I SAM-dependent methyltransferase [Plantactinospora siamensis]|uniref:Class I SAM-dependent methyltransferase n=1 Tax=Plantactinospora siamensis TaxID=555372 RepID=A0ABV6NS28_9ACTN
MSEISIETRQTYDLISETYARVNATPDERIRADAAGLAADLGPGCLVADVGCGPGREVELLRAHGVRVVGFDLSLGQLRAGGVAGVAQADMRRLPVRSGSLDGVWCQAALLHIPRAEVPAVLAEFARIVRIGGALHLNVSEGDGEGWEMAANYGSDRRRWFTLHRLPDLTRLLAEAGFVVRRSGRNRARRDWLRVYAHRADTRTPVADSALG